MLVLARRIEEAIMIEVGSVIIWVKVCGVENRRDGPRVKLGIEAPKEVKVLREELIANEGVEHVVGSERNSTARRSVP